VILSTQPTPNPTATSTLTSTAASSHTPAPAPSVVLSPEPTVEIVPEVAPTQVPYQSLGEIAREEKPWLIVGLVVGAIMIIISLAGILKLKYESMLSFLPRITQNNPSSLEEAPDATHASHGQAPVVRPNRSTSIAQTSLDKMFGWFLGSRVQAITDGIIASLIVAAIGIFIASFIEGLKSQALMLTFIVLALVLINILAAYWRKR
jgi:hypothetical protein